MSDGNPFKNALAKSKAFVADIKIGRGKEKSRSGTDSKNDSKKGDKDGDESDDETSAYANHSYNRRVRVITDAERREYPLDLGENGWKDRSWPKVKEQYALQKKEEEERKEKEEAERRARELQERKTKVGRALMEHYHEYKHIVAEEEKMASSNASDVTSSPDQKRSKNPVPASDRQATMATPPRAASAHDHDSPWFRQPSGSANIAARRRGLPPDESPLRVRTQRPAPKPSPGQHDRHNRKGAKVGSGDWGRETYLAKQGFNVKDKGREQDRQSAEKQTEGGKKDEGEVKEGVKEEAVPGSAVSRWGDGVIKASGATLW